VVSEAARATGVERWEAFAKVLDQRLNEERVEFGDYGAVLGVGFVLHRQISKRELKKKRKERCTQHGTESVSLLPLYTTHSSQSVTTDIRE
jgi:hypothetical protein